MRLRGNMTLMEQTAYITKDWPIIFEYNRLQPVTGGDIEIAQILDTELLIRNTKYFRRLGIMF